MRWIGGILLAGLITAPAVAAERLILDADRDATLFEHAAGLLASGAGPGLFVGRTGQPTGSVRRALIRFDLSRLPRNAVIDSARLIVEVEQARAGAIDVRVHRVLAAWGEGASISMGGAGVPAAAGDATWIHRFFDASAPAARADPRSIHAHWRTPGGDYRSAPSAAATVSAIGPRSFCGADLVADVQHWVRNPRRNHGWILIGDETEPRTAVRIASRQGLLMSSIPRLEILYHRPGRSAAPGR